MNTLANSPELAELEKTLRAEAEASDAGVSSAPTAEGADKNPDAGERAASGEAAKDTTKQDPARAGAPASDKSEEQATAKDSAPEPKAGDNTKEEKTESRYQKAKKDGDRLDKSWKALNEEKDRVAKERAEVERLRQEALQRQKEAQEKAPPAVERSTEGIYKYTPEELDQAAKEFEDEGNAEMAAKARQAAQTVRSRQAQAATEKQTAAVREKSNAAWAEAVKTNPDLANAQSALSQDVAKVFQQHPVLSTYPEGIRDAVALSKLQAKASESESLAKRVTELESENKKLREATSLNSSPPSKGPSQPKEFNDMNSDEQERFLRGQMDGKTVGDLVPAT